MFSINNQWEMRKVTICSLVTCIYLPSIISVLCYNDLVYNVGKASSFHVLAAVFVAEFLKIFYLNSHTDLQVKRNKFAKSKVSDFAKYVVFLLFIVFCFFVGIILFGAPFLDHHEETLMLSVLLTLLTIFPLIGHSGIETSMQLLFGVQKYNRESVIEMLISNALFTVCGAWLGAVVIPLDWGRKWQDWPIPCYLGAIAGYLFSNVLTVIKVSLVFAAVKYPSINKINNMLHSYHTLK